ncbi:serine/threonine-protein kinase [Dactylosporangium matsuzakiense]|uniref:serine/threonine-protein kinase n=1 Tax=Dactylosporangium matsuzakiense TaxID=53360 RepID=UPI0021C3E274|nr:serine/threonine-protein kinase [Dactylosporangium matsuzakiense]UWZ49164.1 serine/threonine protein kinase [Dactylosporangium matsuzakiense]
MDVSEPGGEAQVLGGRYRLDDILGVGGMSVVWQAHDGVLGRAVAVKLLSGRYAADERSRRRIRKEARAAAALSHPNVAQVYDFGEAEEDGAPVPYVVMELVPGPTLAQRMKSGPVLPSEALTVCAEIAAGLAAAHAIDLVHLDVKPANVILAPSGAKLVDFGIAAAAGPIALNDTDASGRPLFGTPHYLAPERLTAEGPVTPASDVYSLGVLLFKLLAGTLPWPVDGEGGIFDAHLNRVAAPLPPIAGVPPEVGEVVRRCLAKHPGSRPTAEEVATALGATPLVHRQPSRLRRALVVTAAAVGGGTAATVLAWALATAPGNHAAQPEAGSRPSADGTAATNPTGAAAQPAATGTVTVAPGPGGGTPPTGLSPVLPAGNPTTTTAAPGPTTTTATTPAADPTTTAPPAGGSGTQTFSSEGGTVTAECTADNQAHVTSSSPTRPYKVDDQQPGPASSATVTFRHGNTRVTVTVTCSNGTPTAATTG